jgi:hypothetical protein
MHAARSKVSCLAIGFTPKVLGQATHCVVEWEPGQRERCAIISVSRRRVLVQQSQQRQFGPILKRKGHHLHVFVRLTDGSARGECCQSSPAMRAMRVKEAPWSRIRAAVVEAESLHVIDATPEDFKVVCVERVCLWLHNHNTSTLEVATDVRTWRMHMKEDQDRT